MTGQELTPLQVLDIQAALGVEPLSDGVLVLAIDPAKHRGTVKSLDPDEVVWFTGREMAYSNQTRHRTGTLQVTFKRKPVQDEAPR